MTRSGTGQGRVTSSPAGVDCGTTCSTDYLSYTKVTLTEVTLTATAEPGSTFGGWNGACAGSAPTSEADQVTALQPRC